MSHEPTLHEQICCRNETKNCPAVFARSEINRNRKQLSIVTNEIHYSITVKYHKEQNWTSFSDTNATRRTGGSVKRYFFWGGG